MNRQKPAYRFFQSGLAALLVFSAVLPLGSEAFAWGKKGHHVICEIAFRLANPHAQAEIQRLIALDASYKSFAEACFYPDSPRQRPAEHFINFPRDSVGTTTYECPLADECLLTAIPYDFGRLALRGNDVERLAALKFLGHWIGDIHQPLHVSFLDDRGGNEIGTTGKCRGNLHAVWDNCLVERAVGDDLTLAISQLVVAITPPMKAAWTTSGPLDWANETFAVTKSARIGYCVMREATCERSSDAVNIGSDYFDANVPVVRDQIQKAGARLAHLLDLALAN